MHENHIGFGFMIVKEAGPLRLWFPAGVFGAACERTAVSYISLYPH